MQNISTGSIGSSTDLNQHSNEQILTINRPILPDIYENRPNLRILNKISSKRSNSFNSKNVIESTKDCNTIVNSEQDRPHEFYFSTYKDEQDVSNIDLGAAMSHSSMNAFINARKPLFIKQAYPLNPFNNDKLDFQPPVNEFILTSNNQCKKLGLDKQPILPNLNAVKRHNIPLKGLAFREAKTRIHYSTSIDNVGNEWSPPVKSDTTAAASIAYYTYQNSKTLPEEYFRNFNINTNTIVHNSSFMKDAENPQKKTYKEIFRGIRRGVTINLGGVPPEATNVNSGEKAEVNRNSAKQKSNKENLKNLKILKVKGDRITSFEILNSSEPYSPAKKISKTARFDPNNNMTRYDMNNVSIGSHGSAGKPKPSYLSTSNLSFKSNLSTQSMGANLRRINPTPEIS